MKKQYYISNKYGNWRIIKYNNKDWSVYLMDSDGIYQFQMQWKTLKEAKAHCGE